MNINTQTKWIIGLAVVLALVVGILIGNCFDGNRSDKYGMHRMPNGDMMMNDGSMKGAHDMNEMMDGMAKSLEGKTGDAFDSAFLKEMIVHHEGAVVMAEQVLSTSKRPELIKLANDIITAQTGEIKMMGDWQKAWFK